MMQIKEKAVDLIRQMPEDHMFYVIDMLQNLKISIADKENEKNRLWRHFKIYKKRKEYCNSIENMKFFRE